MGIAGDAELIRRIDQWPHNKRQPLLILAAARFLGAQISPYRDFRSFLDDHWAAVSEIVLSRSTQTNEAGRCATLLPSLAQISAAEGRPLALIEVGASAGLALFPDRYGYEFVGLPTGRRRRGATADDAGGRRPGGRRGSTDDAAGSGWRPAWHVSGPALRHRRARCRCRRKFPGWRGVPGSTSTPWTCATRTTSPGSKPSSGRSRSSGLNGCARRSRSPRERPPLLVAGDLNEQLVELAGRAPADAALVVFHSAVMAYLDAGGRSRFRRTMADLAAERGCHWLSNEGHTVVAQADGSSVVPEMDDARLRGRFLLLQDGQPAAITGPHGQSLEWL